MEVKPGYKQSEVGGDCRRIGKRAIGRLEFGQIPKDWEIVRLGQLAKFITSGSRGWAKYYSDTGALFVRSQNVRSGRLDFTDQQYVTPPGGGEGTRTRIYSGDILITITGNSVGNVASVNSDIGEAYISQHVGLVRLADTVAGEVRHYISGTRINWKSANFRKPVGTKQTWPKLKELRRFRDRAAASGAEQQAITEALSDADALIESLEQLIAKKRHIKQGAMQELLCPKDGWVERTLLELAGGKKELFDDGDWIESEHITDEGIRPVQTGNIGVGKFLDRAARKYICDYSFTSLHCKEIREGDLLICRLAEPAGRACVLPNIGERKIVTSVDVTIFRPPVSIADRVFLANLFSTDQWFRAVGDRSGGTTHKRISRGSLGCLKIEIPSLAEQTAIAAILSDMDAEIAALETKLAKTRQIKQGMMQELLTGRIRLV